MCLKEKNVPHLPPYACVGVVMRLFVGYQRLLHFLLLPSVIWVRELYEEAIFF